MTNFNKCSRCEQEVPEFLWVGADHPVLTDHPVTINRMPMSDNPNEIKWSVHAYTSTQMCSDLYPQNMEDETIELQGKTFLVTHLAMQIPENAIVPPPGLFIASCTGKYARFVSDTDSRLRILCDACRHKALKELTKE